MSGATIVDEQAEWIGRKIGWAGSVDGQGKWTGKETGEGRDRGRGRENGSTKLLCSSAM